MSYRPITDTWILARAKLKDGEKYYGAYPGGFPERARVLLGVPITEPLLHVCGGKAKLYPYAGGFGDMDGTMDLNPALKPNILHDVNGVFPTEAGDYMGHLCDPPYSPGDAKFYMPGADKYPNPRQLLKNCLNVLKRGQRVGMLHYLPPRPPERTKFVACITVMVGFDNRIRCYSVFEKL